MGQLFSPVTPIHTCGLLDYGVIKRTFYFYCCNPFIHFKTFLWFIKKDEVPIIWYIFESVPFRFTFAATNDGKLWSNLWKDVYKYLVSEKK